MKKPVIIILGTLGLLIIIYTLTVAITKYQSKQPSSFGICIAEYEESGKLSVSDCLSNCAQIHSRDR